MFNFSKKKNIIKKSKSAERKLFLQIYHSVIKYNKYDDIINIINIC